MSEQRDDRDRYERDEKERELQEKEFEKHDEKEEKVDALRWGLAAALGRNRRPRGIPRGRRSQHGRPSVRPNTPRGDACSRYSRSSQR